MQVKADEIEYDVRYSSNKDTMIKINDDFYTKSEAYQIARDLMAVADELLDCINNRDIKDK